MKRALHFAIREARAAIRPGYQLLGLAAAVTVLAWLGPFDTWGRLALPDRAAFWTLATSANWIFGLALGFVAGRVLKRHGLIAWTAAVVGGSAIAAVPGTAVVWLLVVAYMDHRMTGFTQIASLYSQVIVVHLVLNALVTWLVHARSRTDSTEGEAIASRPSAEAAAAAAPFLERIPERLGRNLLHLYMQDHYVEVHTDVGSDLLLLRFRDALREVEGIDGTQVHRSHWVARGAVDGVERRNGRIALRLVNGTVVPVSRSFAPALRERGWL